MLTFPFPAHYFNTGDVLNCILSKLGEYHTLVSSVQILLSTSKGRCFPRCTIASLSGPSRRRQWHPTPVLLPGKSHGWRSLVGYRPWGHEESDTVEWLHFHFALSCIGEGNGNPLQCSCLENPRDRGAWWAAVYGVSQSQTRLKWLSSSSSSMLCDWRLLKGWRKKVSTCNLKIFICFGWQ